MTDLTALLTRVEAATGPDRELDARIMCALNGYTMHEDSNPDDGIFAFWDGAPWKSTCHNCTIWPSPTASLDAALALVEEVLPGKYWYIAAGRIRRMEPPYAAKIVDRDEDGIALEEPLGIAEHEHSPALAVLSALLRAVIAKQEEGDAQ